MGKSILTKLGGVALAIVVGLGIYFVKAKGEDKVEQAQAPDVGECVHFEKDGADDKPVDATCGTAESSHKVVGDKGGCVDPETTYKVGRPGDDALVELCLVYDATKGDCFDDAANDKIDCAAAKGNKKAFKVVSVGKSGDKCANPGQPYEYPERKILLCIVGAA